MNPIKDYPKDQPKSKSKGQAKDNTKGTMRGVQTTTERFQKTTKGHEEGMKILEYIKKKARRNKVRAEEKTKENRKRVFKGKTQ